MSDDAIVRRVRELTDEVGALKRLELPGLASGTWTPVLVGTTTPGTYTYTTQSGKWSRYGSVVLLWFEVRVSAISVAATGQMILTGLPFSVRQRAAVTWAFLQGAPATPTAEVLDTEPPRIALYTANASWGPSNISTSTWLIGSAVYVPI